MKLIGLGWKLKKNEIFPETEKEVANSCEVQLCGTKLPTSHSSL